MGVAEGDESLVLAAVVPFEEPAGEERAERVEQALEPADRRRGRRQRIASASPLVGDLVLTFDGRCEERRRRQLVPVAGHDDLFGAVQRGDSLFLQDLARLVEDHEIEMPLTAIQQLADRQAGLRSSMARSG